MKFPFDLIKTIYALCVGAEGLKAVTESVFIDISGVTHMVYPGAVHSRFEHSLGVYWLAGATIHLIKNWQVGKWLCTLLTLIILTLYSVGDNYLCIKMVSLQGEELGIDRFDIQTVKLAGNYMTPPWHYVVCLSNVVCYSTIRIAAWCGAWAI